jgi:pimeloyl-ACP methyl ester carboxylesterase
LKFLDSRSGKQAVTGGKADRQRFAASAAPGRARPAYGVHHMFSTRATGPAPAGRRAEGMGGGAEPEPYRKIGPIARSALSQDRRTLTAAIGTLELYRLTDTARRDYLSSPGLSLVLRGRAPRRVDALRAHLPGAAAGPARPAAHDRGAGADHQRRERPRGAPVNACYLHERLPKSKLDTIDAGHFLWEDAADTYAALVTSWWAGGYANAGSGSRSRPE